MMRYGTLTQIFIRILLCIWFLSNNCCPISEKVATRGIHVLVGYSTLTIVYEIPFGCWAKNSLLIFL